MKIEFDGKIGEYYIIYDIPTIIGSGRSLANALKDVRQAALFYVKESIKGKLKEVSGRCFSNWSLKK